VEGGEGKDKRKRDKVPTNAIPMRAKVGRGGEGTVLVARRAPKAKKSKKKNGAQERRKPQSGTTA